MVRHSHSLTGCLYSLFHSAMSFLLGLMTSPQPAFTCSKLNIEALEQVGKHGVKYRSGVFIVYFEHISHLSPIFTACA